MADVQTKEQVFNELETAAVDWLTGGEPDTGIEVVEKKMTSHILPSASFLAKSDKSIIILYVWKASLGGGIQVSQESTIDLYSDNADGELELARAVFKTLMHRL